MGRGAHVRGLLRAFLLLAVCLTWFSKAYSAEEVLPQFTFIGPVSDIERKAASDYRQKMLDAYEHWKRAGLEKLPEIESLVYVTTWKNVHIREVLSVYNSSIPDIVAHVDAQYQHFRRSELYQLLGYLERKAKLPPGLLTTKFFDRYANMRYGFGVPNFYEAVQKDALLEDQDTDNAYYGRFPRIDLTETLPLRDPEGKLTAIFLTFLTERIDSISLYRLTGMSNQGMSRRIVILPRLGETAGSLDRSTLTDPTVGVHEFGHHINATQGETPRVVDEAMADNIAASLFNDPKIGAGFAAVSGIIAQELAKSPEFFDQYTAKHLAELAAQGSLRDMSAAVTIDEISRYHAIADDYSAGNPLRTFLWNLRHSGLDVARVDKVALAAIREMARVPLHVSEQAAVAIDLRQLLLEMRRMKIVKKKYDELVKQAGQLTKEQETEIRVMALDFANKVVKDREKASAESRMKRIRAGEMEARPMTVFDYIIPEYFRAFYRAAEELGFTDISETFAMEAAKVMNSNAKIYTTRSGRRHVVFIRYSQWLNDPQVDAQIRAHLDKVEMLATEWTDAMVALMLIENGKDDANLRADVERIEREYLDSLARIQEFERTGLPTKLTNPWPNHNRLKKLAEKINAACQAELVKISEDNGGIAFNATEGT